MTKRDRMMSASLNILRPIAVLASMLTSLHASALAQEVNLEERLAALEAATSNAAYVDNSYLFLIGGIIVMFMAAGFCLWLQGFAVWKLALSGRKMRPCSR